VGAEDERRFLIVAGEASGDLHAARMVQCLEGTGPYRIRGAAGPAMTAAGVEPIVDAADLTVLGFSGVIRHLPRILRAYRRLLAEVERFRPHAAVLVDSPGFNFRLGPALKRRGVRIFYYIAPQVWAWHEERARAMARWVDRLAVVFPFEEPLFREAGVPTEFVGHPLLDGLAPEVDEATFRREIGAGPHQAILGLLPGSRTQEVRHHLGVMVEAASRLAAGRSGLVPVVPIAPGIADRDVAIASAAGVRLVRGRTRAVQSYATACAVASGTATLETALFQTPLVAVYRVGRINYAIARRVVRLRHIALPNIVAGREVARELIQDALTGPALAEALAPLLDLPEARARARGELAEVRRRLGEPGASRRAAAALRALVS
jgi:lipid-A-disaccharide synthase